MVLDVRAMFERGGPVLLMRGSRCVRAWPYDTIGCRNEPAWASASVRSPRWDGRCWCEEHAPDALDLVPVRWEY